MPSEQLLAHQLSIPHPPPPRGKNSVSCCFFSVVVYVTGDVGGPTLVTTQRLTSKRLADRGWIVHPRVNRVCMFDGGVLHGVIPGRGVPAAAAPAPCTASLKEARESESTKNRKDQSKRNNEEDQNGAGGTGLIAQPGNGEEERAGMRVTWMVAFWRDIQARSRPPPPSPRSSLEKKGRVGGGTAAGNSSGWQRRLPPEPPSGAGAAQPFPAMPADHASAAAAHQGDRGSTPRERKKTAPELQGGGGGERCSSHPADPTWPALFQKKPDGWGGGGGPGSATKAETRVTPVPIPQVWEDVDAADNRRAGAGVRRLKRLPEYDLCFQGF